MPFHTGSVGIAAPVIVLVIVGASAFAAALIPAMRALRLDPLEALRHD